MRIMNTNSSYPIPLMLAITVRSDDTISSKGALWNEEKQYVGIARIVKAFASSQAKLQ
jgi:hypothetical protein